MEQLPEQTRWATQQMLMQLDSLSEQIDSSRNVWKSW